MLQKNEQAPLRHIDLFMPQFSRYDVLHRFTIKFYEALLRQHQEAKLLFFDSGKPLEFLQTIIADRPSCTLTFNAINPDKDGAFLCDLLKIPHVSWLVDSSNVLFSLVSGSLSSLRNTRFNIFLSVDRETCNVLKEIGVRNVLFLPHAVEKELTASIDENRIYDIVMLASPIDFKAIREEWKKCPSAIADALQKAEEICFKNSKVSYLKAYVQALDLFNATGNIKETIVEHYTFLNLLEKYIRGLDRFFLINSIDCAPIQVYGSAPQKSWKELLQNKSNVFVHEALSFEEAFEVMKKTKIILNSCSWIKDGAHERLFSAMACGALVISTRTPYLEECFVEGKEIVFYDFGQWESVNDIVSYYLKNEEERKNIASQGQKKVHQFHTWDHRAQVLIDALPPLIEKTRT